MATLPESPNWETGIYQLETTDPVQGGVDGVDNVQAKQLANRTAWLKQQQEAHESATDPHPQYINNAELETRIAALVNSSPAALDTLAELAAALGNDASFAATITNALAGKLGKTERAADSEKLGGLSLGQGNTPTSGILKVGDFGIGVDLQTDSSPYSSDLNSLMTSGVFAFNAGTTGAPCAYGTCFVIGRAGGELSQIVIDLGGTLYSRSRVSGNFSAWRISWSSAPADFTSSLATNGYQRLPSGLIIQWGTATASSVASGTLTTVTLPVAFPTICASALATNTGASGGNSTYNTTVKSASSFTVQRGNNQNIEQGTSFNWFAIGY